MKNRNKLFGSSNSAKELNLKDLSDEELQKKRDKITSMKVDRSPFEADPEEYNIIVMFQDDDSAYKVGPYCMDELNERFADLLSNKDSKQESEVKLGKY